MNKLLVAYDYSPGSEIAVQYAISIAKKFNSHIWLLNIVEPDPEFVGYKTGPKTVRDQVAKEYHQEHKKLQDMAKSLKKTYSQITALSVQGATEESIINQASKLDVDMILVGCTGKSGLKTVLLGSISENVVKNADRSVLVCR